MTHPALISWLLLAFQQDGKPLQRPEENGARLCRVHHAAPKGAVVDGDTIRLLDLDASVRIFGIDAEETFKKAVDEESARRDFAAYCKAQQAEKKRPVKYGTPLGMATKKFAEEFFKGVETVKMVPDDRRRERDYYGRYLGHLLVDRSGKGEYAENFAVELVRAGYSPYFVKYGTSKLFHEQFVAAEEDARRNGRGIWSRGGDTPAHYPDYAERLEWWNRRREAIARFEREHAKDPKYFQLGYDDVLERLQNLAKEEPGATVILFGTVGEQIEENGAGRRGTLAHRSRKDITVLFPSKDDLGRLRWADFQEEYVYVEATVWPAARGAGVEIRIDAKSRSWQE